MEQEAFHLNGRQSLQQRGGPLGESAGSQGGPEIPRQTSSGQQRPTTMHSSKRASTTIIDKAFHWMVVPIADDDDDNHDGKGNNNNNDNNNDNNNNNNKNNTNTNSADNNDNNNTYQHQRRQQQGSATAAWPTQSQPQPELQRQRQSKDYCDDDNGDDDGPEKVQR
jgi:hypothetical protein